MRALSLCTLHMENRRKFCVPTSGICFALKLRHSGGACNATNLMRRNSYTVSLTLCSCVHALARTKHETKLVLFEQERGHSKFIMPSKSIPDTLLTAASFMTQCKIAYDAEYWPYKGKTACSLIHWLHSDPAFCESKFLPEDMERK